MAALNFDLVGVNNYEILQHILYTQNIKTILEPKNYAYLEKVSLYLSKMIMFDIELVSGYNYSTLATACLYVAFKIIEQVDPLFNSDQQVHPLSIQIKTIIESLIQNDVTQSSTIAMEAASKVLSLAKSFDKEYPTLTNLRKFNGFATAGVSCYTERPPN
jgi:hypothetical protein